MSSVKQPGDYILEVARARVVATCRARVEALVGAVTIEAAIDIVRKNLDGLSSLAAEVVGGLDAVPFVEDYIRSQMTNTNDDALRKGAAMMAQQFEDLRAIHKFGVDDLLLEIRAGYERKVTILKQNEEEENEPE